MRKASTRSSRVQIQKKNQAQDSYNRRSVEGSPARSKTIEYASARALCRANHCSLNVLSPSSPLNPNGDESDKVRVFRNLLYSSGPLWLFVLGEVESEFLGSLLGLCYDVR